MQAKAPIPVRDASFGIIVGIDVGGHDVVWCLEVLSPTRDFVKTLEIQRG